MSCLCLARVGVFLVIKIEACFWNYVVLKIIEGITGNCLFAFIFIEIFLNFS